MTENRHIVRWCALAVICLAVGCGRSGAVTSEPLQPDHEPRVSSSELNPSKDSGDGSGLASPGVEIAFAGLNSSGGFTTVEFVVHNAGEAPQRIDSVRVFDPAGVAIKARLIRTSSWEVAPSQFEYGVVQVETSRVISRLQLYTQDVGSSPTVVESRCRLPSGLLADGVFFSPDLSLVYLYAETDEEAPDVPRAECFVNGQLSDVIAHAVLPRSPSGSVISLVVRPAEVLGRGERAFVEVRLPDGLRFGRCRKVFDSFHVRPNQYEFPFRVVGVDNDDQWLRLTVYNESDSSKPDLLVESVAIDNMDVTSRCRLPRDPIPADRHRFQLDARVLELPLPWRHGDPDGTYDIDIGFRLARSPDSRSDATPMPERTRNLKVRVRAGMNVAIGCEGGPCLKDCASLHNGGLRDVLPVGELRHRVDDVIRAAPDIPVYARTFDGRDLQELHELGPILDFLVVSPPQFVRVTGGNPASEFVAYHAGIRELKLPFITSIPVKRGSLRRREDLRWMILAALAGGSKGVLLPLTPPEDIEDPTSYRSFVESFIAGRESLSRLLATSCPVSLAIQCNQPGIDVSELLNGPDRIILILVNRWCTRSSAQLEEPSYAVLRTDVRLSLELGSGWVVGDAWDVGDGSMLELGKEGSQVSLAVPPFETGRVVMLRRAGVTKSLPQFADSDRVVVSSLFAEQIDAIPALTPLSSPFVRVGMVEAGYRTRIELSVRNELGRAIEIKTAAVGHQRSSPGQIVFEPCEVDVHGEGVLVGEFTAPEHKAVSVTRYEVFPGDERDGGFQLFVDASTEYALDVEPSYVDFGRGSAVVPFREVRVKAIDPRFRVSDVASDTLPIDVRIGADGRSFRFRPISVPMGRFTGTARVETSLDGGTSTRTSYIHFGGERKEGFTAKPPGLVLAPHGLPQERRILVLHADNQPFVVEAIAVEGDWLQVDELPKKRSSQHVLHVNVLSASRSQKNSSISIRCRSDDGVVNTINVPVRIVNYAQSRPNSRDDVGAIGPVVERVRSAVTRLQKTNFANPPPNWIVAHALLMHGDGAFERSRADPELRGLFDRFLNDPQVAEPPFVLRRGLPFPRQRGEMFAKEHHRDQFLHILSMTGTPLDAAICVDGKSFTVRELLKQSLLEVRLQDDLSWTLSSYATYLKPSENWRGKFDERFSFVAIAESTLDRSSLYCGGTHQLSALARVASRPELRSDETLGSLMRRIERRIEEECTVLRKRQDRDGSFALPDSLRRENIDREPPTPHGTGIYYTGHTLEWLAVAFPADRLREDWIVKAADYLANAVSADYGNVDAIRVTTDEQCFAFGFVSHAISGLQRWLDKVAAEEALSEQAKGGSS